MNDRRKEIIEKDLEEIYSRNVPWEELNNKTVLITGAYGMLASYMVFMLMYLNEKKGINVKIIAQGRSEEKFRKRFGDIEKYPYLEMKISELDEDIPVKGELNYIVHAASLANPSVYGVCPIEVLKPNIIGNYYLLELATEKKTDGYLMFSSGDIYGTVAGVNKISEQDYGAMDPLDIHNCYSESKRMAETMCISWLREKDVPVKLARIWHTYAPTMDIDSDPRVFASFVKDIVEKRNIIMRSDGKAKRSFCYITDAVTAFFLILLHGTNGEAYNVCNTKEFCSISDLAGKLAGLYPELNLRVVKEMRNEEDTYLENSVANVTPPDNSKLEKLGWKAEIDIQTGFKRVVDSMIVDD